MARQPQWAYVSSSLRFHDHTQTQPLGLLCTNDRSVTETLTWQHTQHSQDTEIHAPDEIRTPNPSKRAAADPFLWSGDHCDRQWMNVALIIYINFPAREENSVGNTQEHPLWRPVHIPAVNSWLIASLTNSPEVAAIGTDFFFVGKNVHA